MKRAATIILQGLTCLIGLAVLAFLVWEPTAEGRNADATLFATYFTDPFLAYAYVASIAVFTALYQAFRFWGYAGRDRAGAREAVRALRIIRYCALILIAFVAGGEVILWLTLPATEDRAGGVFMGVLVTFGAILMAVGSMVIERALQKNAAQSGPAVET